MDAPSRREEGRRLDDWKGGQGGMQRLFGAVGISMNEVKAVESLRLSPERLIPAH